jgi:hypothetical protein
MKQSIVRVAAAVWTIGLLLTGLLLSVPPAWMPIFLGQACIAIIPLVLGTRHFQMFGIAAVIVSLVQAYGEYEAGLLRKARMERFRQMVLQGNAATNAPATNGSPAPHE